MRIRAIAVDDEVLALDKIERFCKQVDFINLLAKFDNPVDASYYLKHNIVDVIFLDVQMDEYTGIELIKSLDVKPKIILTTAFSQYSLKAFELDVTDYLMKPIRFDRFRMAANKARKLVQMEKSNIDTTHSVADNGDYIFVKSGRKTIKIYLNDILYIEGMKDYLSVTTYKKKFLVLMVFNKMIDLLPEDKFVRIHRSFIVAFDQIESVQADSVLICSRNIPVSKTYRSEFKTRFEKFAGK